MCHFSQKWYGLKLQLDALSAEKPQLIPPASSVPISPKMARLAIVESSSSFRETQLDLVEADGVYMRIKKMIQYTGTPNVLQKEGVLL